MGFSTKGALFFRYLRDLAKSKYEAPCSVPYDSTSTAYLGLRTNSDPSGITIDAIDERLIRCRAH